MKKNILDVLGFSDTHIVELENKIGFILNKIKEEPNINLSIEDMDILYINLSLLPLKEKKDFKEYFKILSENKNFLKYMLKENLIISKTKDDFTYSSKKIINDLNILNEKILNIL